MSEHSWHCPRCQAHVASAYCPACGERPLLPHEFTARGILSQALRAITSVDDRLIRTTAALVRRPGSLTRLYVTGPRKPYIGPFALFLLANVLFVAVEPLARSHVFSATLENHLQRQPWSDYAHTFVTARLATVGQTLETYAPIFNAAVDVNARSLIIVMAFVFALLPPLVFPRQRRAFLVNVVFSLHVHAFMLLIFSVALIIPAIDMYLGGQGLLSQRLDNMLAIALLSTEAVYLYAAVGPVYGASGVARFVQGLVLAGAAAFIVLGYRLFLFLLTLYSTT